MNILDQKQDVIKVELTKHGRKMLGAGIFQPKYFSFHDNSIIYDYSYANINNESINDIQDRIIDQTLTFGALNLLAETIENPLGSSDITNNLAPAWDLVFLNGKIKNYHTGSKYGLKVFDLGDMEYTISLPDIQSEPIIEEDYILIDLKELNIGDDIENFEIEVITYDAIAGGKDGGLEKKLLFSQYKTNVIDNILYEDSELPYNYFNLDISNKDVGYFLDVLVDHEIDTDFITKKPQKIPEIIGNITPTYTSNNTPDICEPCCDEPDDQC